VSAPPANTITYIATSAVVPGDVAFAERIALHRARRPAAWGLIEADHDLAGALRAADAGPDAIVLIDCLTLWLTRLLCPMDADAPRADWEACLADFHDALTRSRCRVVLVSNEIGLGVVPMGAMTRLFVDEMGRLNQRVAAACDRVVFTVAGLPLDLKGGAAHSSRQNRWRA
jgi:adenosylcobinamide kinase / adenosylcobinamide-phosphate guanylyltransferase